MIHATLHQLKVFEATARHGSFTRAAEELFLTQPTVSMQVKQLTKAIGLPLFEQVGKRLYLTDAGQELYTSCKEIFDRLERLEMTIADLKGMKQGRLRLAVITTTKYFMPRMLGPFCQQYPGINVSLTVTNHERVLDRLANNQDDLYVMSQVPEHMDIISHPFLENPLVVVAPANHPLAQEKGKLSIERVAQEMFIMREPGSGTRRAFQKLLDAHKLSIKVRLELGSNEAIKQAVAGGLGLSVLSRHTLLHDSSNEVVMLDVEGFPIERYWYLVYLSSKQLSVVAQTFLEYLRETAHQFSPNFSEQLAASENDRSKIVAPILPSFTPS